MQFETYLWVGNTEAERDENKASTPGELLTIETGAGYLKHNSYAVSPTYRIVGAEDPGFFGSLRDLISFHTGGDKYYQYSALQPIGGWPEGEKKAKTVSKGNPVDELIKRLKENPGKTPEEIAAEMNAELEKEKAERKQKRAAKKQSSKSSSPEVIEIDETQEREKTPAELESERVQKKYAAKKAEREAREMSKKEQKSAAEQQIAEKIGGGWEAEITTEVAAEGE